MNVTSASATKTVAMMRRNSRTAGDRTGLGDMMDRNAAGTSGRVAGGTADVADYWVD